MKKCLRLIAATVLIFIPTVARAQNNQLQRAVVKIQSKGGRSGTGFVVCLEKERAYIVTAAHVVYGDQQPQISLFPRDSVSYQATVVKLEGADTANGLALIQLQGSSVAELKRIDLDTEEPGTADRVTVIGFPASGPPWSATEGTVSGRKGSKIAFTAAADEGNSGGPLLKGGKAIGLVTDINGKFGYATPASTLRVTLGGWGFSDCLATPLHTKYRAGSITSLEVFGSA